MTATSRPGKADPRLRAALRACARGIYPLEAGVELLIGHASWLHRGDFIHAFVHTATSVTDGTETADIDWTEAITALDNGNLPCSGGEQRMLRLAASIAGGIPVSLREALTGIDERNTRLVITAVLHTSGQRPSTVTS